MKNLKLEDVSMLSIGTMVDLVYRGLKRPTIPTGHLPLGIRRLKFAYLHNPYGTVPHKTPYRQLRTRHIYILCFSV